MALLLIAGGADQKLNFAPAAPPPVPGDVQAAALDPRQTAGANLELPGAVHVGRIFPSPALLAGDLELGANLQSGV